MCCKGGSSQIVYEQPEPRDIKQEGLDTIEALKSATPEVLALKQQYDPQFADATLKVQESTQGRQLDLARNYDAYARQKSRQDISNQRQGDVTDLKNLSTDARDAYFQANPEARSRLSQVNSIATGIQQSGSRSDMLDSMAAQSEGQTPAERSAAAQGYNLNQYDTAPYPSQTSGQGGGACGRAIMGPQNREARQAASSNAQMGGGLVPRSTGNTSRISLQNTGQPVPARQAAQAQQTSQARQAPLGGCMGGARKAPQARQAAQSSQAQGFGQYGVSPLQASLEAQAADELAAGSGLTGRERRDIRQASRAAFNDRGLYGSNAAVIDEITGQMEAGNKRLRERQAFAAQTAGMGEGMRMGREQLGLAQNQQQFSQGLARDQFGLAQDQAKFGQKATTEQLTQARQGMDRNYSLNALQASQLIDPASMILNRPLATNASGMFQQGQNAALGSNSMNFNPYTNQYASNLYGGNQQTAANIAMSNQQAALQAQQNQQSMCGGGVGALLGMF